MPLAVWVKAASASGSSRGRSVPGAMHLTGCHFLCVPMVLGSSNSEARVPTRFRHLSPPGSTPLMWVKEELPRLELPLQ